jgi:homoserine dehydrogenase
VREIGIGLIGCGIVGSGTVALLTNNAELIASRVGAKLVVRKIAVRDIAKVRDVSLPSELFTTNVEDVISDPDVDIVAELVGGVDPAKSWIEAAFAAKKQVVTANKELMAKHGHALVQIAQDNKLDFYAEGSVAGGIPIIAAMGESLAANRIQAVMGIVNGTTNFILSKMADEGAGFDDVLREAQALGYAEADPTADVDAHDARYKIAILASIGFGTPVDESSVISEGIRTITARDIAVAKDLDHVIKLVAVAEQWEEQGTMHVRVHPALLQKDHPLASVNGAYNAVLVRGDGVGDTMFYGRGAGSLPTGSAVVGDLIAVSRNLVSGSTGRVHRPANANLRMLPRELVTSKFYVRMTAKDLPKVLSQVSNVFGDFDVSIESVIQRANSKDEAEIVLITHRCLEENFRGAVDVAERLPVVTGVHNWIRVEA